MNQIKRLAPAESLILLKGDTTPKQELLRVTFFDLVLRQVLEVNTHKSTGKIAETVSTVSPGKNFGAFTPRVHERPFYLTLKHGKPPLSLSDFTLSCRAYAGAARDYRKNLVKSENLAHCFSSGFFQKMKGKFSYTEEGKKLRESVVAELLVLKKDLEEHRKPDTSGKLEILCAAGAAVFLTGLPFSTFSAIDWWQETRPISHSSADGEGNFHHHQGNEEMESAFDDDDGDDGDDGDGDGDGGDGGD